jgi:hypothetical protein
MNKTADEAKGIELGVANPNPAVPSAFAVHAFA